LARSGDFIKLSLVIVIVTKYFIEAVLRPCLLQPGALHAPGWAGYVNHAANPVFNVTALCVAFVDAQLTTTGRFLMRSAPR